jgi:hypothetical protein
MLLHGFYPIFSEAYPIIFIEANLKSLSIFSLRFCGKLPLCQYDLRQLPFVEALVKFLSNDPDQDRRILLDGKKLKTADLKELQKNPFRNLFINGKDLDIAEI